MLQIFRACFPPREKDINDFAFCFMTELQSVKYVFVFLQSDSHETS